MGGVDTLGRWRVRRGGDYRCEEGSVVDGVVVRVYGSEVKRGVKRGEARGGDGDREM
jgi:hypothetical protein